MQVAAREGVCLLRPNSSPVSIDAQVEAGRGYMKFLAALTGIAFAPVINPVRRPRIRAHIHPIPF